MAGGLGNLGEERACRYLETKGYQILEKNFKCRRDCDQEPMKSCFDSVQR